MEKSKINKQLPLLMLLAFVILISASHANQTNEIKTKAEELYKEGMNAVNVDNWRLALEKFKESYQLFPHSLTAYLISCAYLELENPADAKRYADKATTGEPKLEEPFLTHAKRIIDWAKKAENDDYYKITGKADDPEQPRPKNPKIKPPQPKVPQQKALGRETPVVFKQVLVVPFSAQNLTGKWKGNDGGSYFLRQIDNELWWYGQSKDGGKTWSNVFYGSIKGNYVTGKWADMPHGLAQNSGMMTIKILGNNKLKAIKKTGGFGGSEWSR